MSRIQSIDPDSATGRAGELLASVQGELGMVPNLARALATSPAALDAYLTSSRALARGRLPAPLREQIALTVAEANQCQYCLGAHSAVGRMLGLSDEAIADGRHASSPDRRVEAALRFARRLVESRGVVSDDDLCAVRAAGYDDGAITEIVANVSLSLFTNYFNQVARTELDYPVAPKKA